MGQINHKAQWRHISVEQISLKIFHEIVRLRNDFDPNVYSL